MRANKVKRQKLQRQITDLKRQLRRLVQSTSDVEKQCSVLEELLQHRNALLAVLECLQQHRGEEQPASSTTNAAEASTALAAATADAVGAVPAEAAQAELQEGLQDDGYVQQLLEQLPTGQPMAAALTDIDAQLVDSVMALTCDAAADFWVKQVKDVALLLYMHDHGQHDVHAALDTTVIGCMRWCLAVHIFNPHIMYALHDYNLVTRRYQTPDPQHWATVRESGRFTEEQQHGIAILLSLVQPRLQQLEEAKQGLLAEIEQLEEQFRWTAASRCRRCPRQLAIYQAPVTTAAAVVMYLAAAAPSVVSPWMQSSSDAC